MEFYGIAENIIQDAATNSFDLYDTDNYSYPLIKIENPNFKLIVKDF